MRPIQKQTSKKFHLHVLVGRQNGVPGESKKFNCLAGYGVKSI